jgi:zinc protease
MPLKKAGCFLLAALTLLPAATKIFPYPYTLEDLPNGLRLITVPVDYPNLVALYIVVGTGSRNEVEPGKSGFAHLFEHLMFRGTPEFSSAQYQTVLKNAGAASNAFTSDDLTVYHTTFSKEDLPRILSMEADRFQHLAYAQPDFKTETLAVLGEYNKNSANPVSKLSETIRATAFKTHTYSHTTMGFLADIQAMPNAYDYSLQFFNRYYRPENTTIIIVGDVEAKQARSMVDERWGAWKRGNFKVQIPAEPPQDGPRTAHVEWPSQTLPWVSVSFRAPGYSDTSKDGVALDAISSLGFTQASPLYQKLVIEDQTVDTLQAGSSDHIDPELFNIYARVKKQSDVESVRQQILATVAEFANKPVDRQKLETLKQHLRYEFALQLDSSEAIAQILAQYAGLRRTPESLNRDYENYAALTPEDIQQAAKKYLTQKNQIIVTLSSAGAK